MEGSFVLSAQNSSITRDMEGSFYGGGFECRLNEVMLATLLRRGKPAGEIARMFGLRGGAVAGMRERLGI